MFNIFSKLDEMSGSLHSSDKNKVLDCKAGLLKVRTPDREVRIIYYYNLYLYLFSYFLFIVIFSFIFINYLLLLTINYEKRFE